MSYDLTLFQVPDGLDAEAAYRQLTEEEESEIPDLQAWVRRPIPDSVRQRMQELADAVKSAWPAFVQFQPASPLPWIELTDSATDVQISFNERSVSINMPYFRKDEKSMLVCVAICLEVLQQHGGYVRMILN